MTLKQIERAYRKLWKHITEGDGYQPFGYDAPTLRMTHPGFFSSRERLQRELMSTVGQRAILLIPVRPNGSRWNELESKQ
jgi:hypothetical protein